MSKEKIVDEIHRAARKNFPRRHVVLKGMDDLWQADLIDIKLYKRENGGYKFILINIDCFSKFVWVVPLKTKSKSEVTLAFKEILKSGRVPNNLQTDNGKEFYNDIFQKLMKTYKINHYSTFSVKKASIVERVIRTIKTKLYKYFSLVGCYKWVGIPLHNIIDKYNNTKHRTTGMKPIDVNMKNQAIIIRKICKKNQINTTKNIKFRVGDHVRISKYKSCFDKGYTPNWSTEVFVINKVIRSDPVTYYLQDRHQQLIKGCFYEKELLKSQYPNLYLIERVIKKKGNKLYVKWLGLNQSENSWIDKKDLV